MTVEVEQRPTYVAAKCTIELIKSAEGAGGRLSPKGLDDGGEIGYFEVPGFTEPQAWFTVVDDEGNEFVITVKEIL